MKFHEVVKELQLSPITPLQEKRTFEAMDDRGIKYIATTEKGQLLLTSGIESQRAITSGRNHMLFKYDWHENTSSLHWTDAIRYWMKGTHIVVCVVEGYDHWFTDKSKFIGDSLENLEIEMLLEGKWYAKEREEGEDDYE